MKTLINNKIKWKMKKKTKLFTRDILVMVVGKMILKVSDISVQFVLILIIARNVKVLLSTVILS